ncbi:RluA family pseudouridine synthase [Neptunomonas sp.]|uniref:RluA family pseudouridine synthase n=1 Tax=Neptunomonas sp. TaxID=1971898 RepID=UPI003564546E
MTQDCFPLAEREQAEGGFCLNFSVLTESVGTVAEFLASRLVERDVARLPHSFREGWVRVDGLVVASSCTLVIGQQITVYLPDHIEAHVDVNWRLLWQNDELIKVYKPALLPVSRTTRNLYQTLISLIRRETAYADARLLHRMDTETSGVLLIAKDKKADQKWKKHFQQLVRRKVYHAWVDGNPAWDQLSFECELSEKTASVIRSRMYVVDPGRLTDYPKPKFSKTDFRVIERQAHKSLIECELLTGRKHQIRAHLAHLGYPIIGDKIYSHDGHFYLKRLQQPLTVDDLVELGAEHHLLESVLLELDDQLLRCAI